MKTKYLFLGSVVLILLFKIAGASFKGLKRIREVSNLSPSHLSPDTDFNELLLWAKSSSFPLFVIPPNDRDFQIFRFASQKGIWGTTQDVNQLAYSPDFYLEMYKRLLTLGFEASMPHEFSFKYEPCFLGQQPPLHAFPIVLRMHANLRCLENFQTLFKNKSFVVLRKK